MLGLNTFGTTITALTAVTLFALAVEIFYVLWQRRRRHRPRVRAEPNEPSLPCSSSSSEREELDTELEQHVKWQCLYGSSRVLFTIKEEEREEAESENGSECSAVVVKKAAVVERSLVVSENVKVDEVAVTVEVVSVNETNDTTPFSTPCASPSFFTPYSSPSRDAMDET